MASVNTNLIPPKPMELKGNLSENWNRWKQSWEYWQIATKLDKEEEPVILASLQHVLGPTARLQKNYQEKTKVRIKAY